MHAILNRRSRVLQTAAAIFLLVAFANAALADIFQWEYINPADPSQGKQQSTTLCPDGDGVDAVPGTNSYNLDRFDLTMAYLNGADLNHVALRSARLKNASMVGANLIGVDFSSIGTCCGDPFIPTDLTSADLSYANLTDASFSAATLTGANLSQSNLTDASFYVATLTDVNFNGADVRRASFYTRKSIAFNTFSGNGTGITAGQLSSTASYQTHDLSGIGLHGNDLASANFTGQKLTGADFSESTLSDAEFTGAQIQGANFSRRFNIIPGYVEFIAGTGITPAQLYTTANFQAHDLRGINLELNDFTGANLAGQNLTSANLGAATLTSADLRGANLANANFVAVECQRFVRFYSPYAALADADLTAADARGAFGLSVSNATTANLIKSDGHISGLDLNTAGLLVIRDHDGYSRIEWTSDRQGNLRPVVVMIDPIAIAIDEHFAIDSGSTLRMVFESDAWNSTISFAPGIPVLLGGTLDLTFADDVNLASQVGRTFNLFDWTGVNPTGAFAIFSPYAWDLSNLYATGEVTLTAIPEPASIVLTAAGFFIPTLYLRRKNP